MSSGAEYHLIGEIDEGRRAEILMDALAPYFKEQEAQLMKRFTQATPDEVGPIKHEWDALMRIKQRIEARKQTGRMAQAQRDMQ